MREWDRIIRVWWQLSEVIRDGKKTLEVRTAVWPFTLVTSNAIVTFADSRRECKKRVIDVLSFPSFDAMWQDTRISAEAIAPGYGKSEVDTLLRDLYPPNKEDKGIIVFVLTDP